MHHADTRQLFFGFFCIVFAALILFAPAFVVHANGRREPRRDLQSRSHVNKPAEAPADDCPHALSVVSFLGKLICVHPCVERKLAVATAFLRQQGLTQASQVGVQRMTGFRSAQKSLHGQGLAIDIDAATNPYLIHERNESQLDAELSEVYERIAQFLIGRASIIPQLGTQRYSRETRRAYAARVYDALEQESRAMQHYFSLMQHGSRLHQYISTAIGTRRARLSSTFRSLLLPNEEAKTFSQAIIDQMRLRMAADWVVLTGHAGPPMVALDPSSGRQAAGGTYLSYPQVPISARVDPETRDGDRPFDAQTRAYPGRSPLKGFLSLKKELVLALIDAEFRWGALDFGRSSGDLMHFDTPASTCAERTDEKSPSPAVAQ